MRLAVLSCVSLVACTATLDFSGISDGVIGETVEDGGGAGTEGGSPRDGSVPQVDGAPIPDGGGSDGDPSSGPQPDHLWLLDENTGGSAQDAIGGKTAAVTGVWAAGVRGSAIDISTAGSFQVSALSGTSFPAEGTLSFYANLGITAYQLFDSRGNAANGIGIEVASGSLRAVSRTFGGGPFFTNVATVTAPPTGAWARIDLTWSTSTKAVSLAWRTPGGAKNSNAGTLPASFAVDGQAFVFGSQFDGRLDEVRLWKRVLTPAELDLVP